MTTLYSDIYNLFSSGFIKDPMLDKLYNQSVTDYEDYLQTFLITAISEFDLCKQDLEDRDDTTKQFNPTLSTKEKVILSKLTRIAWLQKEINDVNQMKLHLQDGDFKTFSEANNLKEKVNLLVVETELVDKAIGKYDLKNYLDSVENE